MVLFRCEREDEIAERNGWKEYELVPCPGFVCERLATAVRKNGMAWIEAHGAVSMGRAYGAPIDDWKYRVHLASVEEALGDEFIYSYNGDYLYIFKKGLTATEFLKIIDVANKPEDIKMAIGLSPWDPHVTVKIIPREEAVEDERRTGIIDSTGKFVCRYKFHKYYDIKGDNAPYVVDAIGERVNDILCSLDNQWYIPVKDYLDRDELNGVVKADKLDGIEFDIPDEETLNRNMEAYTADMIRKIEADIKESGCCNLYPLGEKARMWRWKYLPAEYTTISEYQVVRKDADLFKLAIAFGYDEKCLSNQPRQKYEHGVVINHTGIKAFNAETKDVFEFAKDETFCGKVFYTKTTEYTATKAEIMANFKKRNIDPYEVTKLTTVWHYINFLHAVTECFDNSGILLYDDNDVGCIRKYHAYENNKLEALRFKKNFWGAMRYNGLSDVGLKRILIKVKNIADKLGVPARDPEATLKAAEDRATNRR